MCSPICHLPCTATWPCSRPVNFLVSKASNSALCAKQWHVCRNEYTRRLGTYSERTKQYECVETTGSIRAKKKLRSLKRQQELTVTRPVVERSGFLTQLCCSAERRHHITECLCATGSSSVTYRKQTDALASCRSKTMFGKLWASGQIQPDVYL